MTHSAPLPASSLLSTSHHPLLAVLLFGLRGLYQQVWVCGVWHAHLPEWLGFQRWAVLQVGTWSWPPLYLTSGSSHMIQHPEAGLIPSLLEQHRRKWNNLVSVHLLKVNTNRLWVTLKGYECLLSLVWEKYIAVGNSTNYQILVSSASANTVWCRWWVLRKYLCLRNMLFFFFLDGNHYREIISLQCFLERKDLYLF